jgi:hypothetical protein
MLVFAFDIVPISTMNRPNKPKGEEILVLFLRTRMLN